MVKEISEFDKRLIAELEAKGILSYNTLSSLYGVSERTIYRRMKNLLDRGAIKFIVVPNFMLLGYRTWARIGIGVYPGQLHSVAETLVRDNRIYFVGYTLGRYDIMLSLYCKNIDELTNFTHLTLIENKGIRFVETMLLVQPRKYNLLFWPEPIRLKEATALFENSNEKNNYEGEQIYELDELEGQILETLMFQGPIRSRKLSVMLKISENNIRSRLRKMQRNNVYRIEIVPVGEELESANRATIGIMIHNRSPHDIINELLAYPEVSLASLALGRFNIILVMHYQNVNLLNTFVTEILPTIQGVASSETFIHIKRLKYYGVSDKA